MSSSYGEFLWGSGSMEVDWRMLYSLAVESKVDAMKFIMDADELVALHAIERIFPNSLR